MRNLTLRLIFCFLLATRVVATPLSYGQVASQVGQGQPQSDTKKPQQPPGKISGSSEKPDFVQLIDGRIVPYGPGIVCSDECVQSDAMALSDEVAPRLAPTGVRPWLLAIPAIVGGVVLCAVLCRGGTPTIVSDSSRGITPTPPPAADVPEPTTLVLLGLGLAMMARHGFGKKKSADR